MYIANYPLFYIFISLNIIFFICIILFLLNFKENSFLHNFIQFDELMPTLALFAGLMTLVVLIGILLFKSVGSKELRDRYEARIAHNEYCNSLAGKIINSSSLEDRQFMLVEYQVNCK